jgi:saccharopine dehydrogenase-like NADP-dependent oxidoreductase
VPQESSHSNPLTLRIVFIGVFDVPEIPVAGVLLLFEFRFEVVIEVFEIIVDLGIRAESGWKPMPLIVLLLSLPALPTVPPRAAGFTVIGVVVAGLLPVL